MRTSAWVVLCSLLACGEPPLVEPDTELTELSEQTAQALASGSGVGTVAWNVVGEDGGDRLGTSLTGVGDVNGDGFDDLAVGAPYHYAGGIEDSGRVYVFFGSAAGLSFTPSQIIDGDTMWQYRADVSPAGDVNGDGYRDILIQSTIVGEFGVRLHLGGPNGVQLTHAWEVPLEPLYPRSLGGAGDVNGDGRSDVLVQEREFIASAWEVRIVLYGGTPTGLTAAPIWTYVVAPEFTALSTGAGVGDFTGDGYVDVILGTDWCDASYGGRLVGFWGSASGPSTTPNWIGGDASLGCTHIGKEVERAGDLNGDGYADVLTSSSSYASFDFRGRAQAFLGGAAPVTTPSWDVHTTDNDGWNDISGLGDTNGDGRNDALLGLDNFYNPHNGVPGQSFPPQGRARVYQGRASGTLVENWYAYDERLNGNNFGTTVSGAGDLNGDGWADVAISDYLAEIDASYTRQGFVYVYYGTGGSAPTVPALSALLVHEPMGAAVANDARLQSTNAFDVSCAGRGTQGRTFVALEVELAVGSTPFAGTDIRTQSAYADTGLSGVALRMALTGLDSNTRYRTRARLVYRPDTPSITRHTRWFDGPTVTTNCDATDPDFDDDGTCDDLDADDDEDGTADGADCGPHAASIHPGAPEVLDDGIDQDCSGEDRVTCHVDADHDDHGVATTALGEGDCTTTGLSPTDDDCDDANDARHPDAVELPDDTIDQDCDGLDGMRCYVDQDDDGYGFDDSEAILPLGSCPSSDFSDVPGDCNDIAAAFHPGATDTLDDGYDQNCNGQDNASCFEDADEDGFGGAFASTADGACPTGQTPDDSDCDDDDASIHPGASEVVGDDLDQDCSGADRIICYRDEDDDGFGDSTWGTFRAGTCNENEDRTRGDCDDTAATISPDADDVAGDGIDQNCSGWDATQCFVDADGDGHGGASEVVDGANGCAAPLVAAGGDCDDDDAASHEGAPETANDGIDQNCSGHDAVTCFADLDGDGHGAGIATAAPEGVCRDGTAHVPGDDCDDVHADVHPDADDVAGDAVDQDCDGADAVPVGGVGVGVGGMAGAGGAGAGGGAGGTTAEVFPVMTDEPVMDGGGGGCGCRIGAAPSSKSGLWLLGLLGSVMLRRGCRGASPGRAAEPPAPQRAMRRHSVTYSPWPSSTHER